jgi:hypothetical protein
MQQRIWLTLNRALGAITDDGPSHTGKVFFLSLEERVAARMDVVFNLKKITTQAFFHFTWSS